MVYSVGKAIREFSKNKNSIYFLSGDDYFLQSFFIKNLKKHFDDDYETYYLNFEEESDINSFFEEISSTSLFSNKSILIVRNILKISKISKDEILKYLQNPNDDNVIIFVSDDFYSKNQFLNSISSKSKKIDVRTPFTNKLREWVNYYIKSNSISIDNIILDDIISANNDEIITILNEVEKLYLINGCSQIAYNEKQHISSNHKNIRPWQLIDSIGKKDNIYAIKKIEYLQYIGYQIIPLIIILYNFFNNMLLFKNGVKDLYSINKIISNNMNKYSSNYTEQEIMNIIGGLKNMDLLIKSSSLNQNNLISLFIIKICQGYYG
jgi:DNA polymerase III delta subunit